MNTDSNNSKPQEQKSKAKSRRGFLGSILGAGLIATTAGLLPNRASMAQELRRTGKLVRRIINPWIWGDYIGIVQGNDLANVNRIFIAGGQASVDADGQTLHAGDMRAQCAQAFDNLETVLKAAGYELSDVMRITFYTTDVDLFRKEYDVVFDRLQQANCQPASALIGVTRLAEPDLLFEMEATALL